MEAAEAPTDQRAAQLDRLCAGDMELYREVERLLRADHAANAGAFMSEPTASISAAAVVAGDAEVSEQPGTRIGPFKLLQKIGEGGFGVVFMAEQDEPVRRRVALKVIKLGMDTRQVVARFEQERQALALMDHPHIAKVLDAGATPLTERGGGRPYFVMEYVTGDPITEFADAHRLDVRARLALFAQVCAAVQHAHTKGVIHRDLKPRNVLVSMVDGRPHAKVIDFGIAKATGARLTEKTLFTEHRQLIGTLEYMSPEQAEGSPDIDTRTDVYSLGVLLYELLTGATPFDAARLRSAAWGEMQRIIKEEEPPAPSVRLSRSETRPAIAAARGAEPARLGTQLKGELDWIVMKALDKDRARRYESPNLLAADVQRHLDGEAVLAAPASAGYRMRKFVRRNKGAVVAGGAVAAALVLGGTAASWGLWWAWKSNAELIAANKTAQQSLYRIFTTEMASGETDQDLYKIPDGDGVISPVVTGSSEITLVRMVPKGDGTYWASAVESDRLIGLLSTFAERATAASSKARFELKGRTEQLETANASLTRQAALAREAIEDAAKVLYSCDCPGEESLIPKVIADSMRKRNPEFSEDEISVRVLAQLTTTGAHQVLTSRNDAETNAYAANIALAQIALDAGNWTEARHRISACPPSKKGWEWSLLALKSLSVTWSSNGDHYNPVFSHDGRLVITGGRKAVRLLDARTGAEIRVIPLKNDYGAHRGVASADGTVIAAIMYAGSVRVWDTATAQVIREFDLPPEMAHKNVDLALRPDGKQLATTGGDEAVRIWNLAGDVASPTLTLTGHTGETTSAAYSPDGTKIVTTSRGGVGRLWDTTSGKLLAELTGHADTVAMASFSPDGTRIVTASWDGTARIWDASTGESLRILDAGGGELHSASWDATGSHVATGSSTDAVRIWDATSGEVVATAEGLKDVVASYSPDGASLLVWHGDEEVSTVAVIPVAHLARPEREFDRRNFIDFEIAEALGPVASKSPANTLSVVTRDGNRHITAEPDPGSSGTRFLRFFDANSNLELAVFPMPHLITGIRLSDDDDRLVISLTDGTARIWDIRNAEERATAARERWTERGPAGVYLGQLWESPASTDALRDAVRSDPMLTPLRRLVAAEMLEHRLDDLRREAAAAYEHLTKDQTDAAAVRAAAASADLPRRVKERVVAAAAGWAPTPSR